MTFLNIINFTLNVMMFGLFIFVLYILWLIKKKVEKTELFSKIYTWLLFSIVSVQAYSLLAALISIFALELSGNIISVVLYLPWLVFAFCIYKVGRALWDMRDEFGDIKISEKKILESELNKLRTTLRLLGNEHKEGMITKKSYNELKQRTETKIAETEQKLAEY